jgi:hypothetical protein
MAEESKEPKLVPIYGEKIPIGGGEFREGPLLGFEPAPEAEPPAPESEPEPPPAPEAEGNPS